MGFFSRKVVPEEERDYAPVSRYIDLGTYQGSASSGKGRTSSGSRMEVKVAELDGYEDLRNLSNYVYDGHILILDFTSISNDDLTLKRIISELKRLVKDINGDMAGISQNMLMVTPSGVNIDRRKVRKGF